VRKLETSESDALKAFVAILNADRWLFLAANTVGDDRMGRSSLAAIRALTSRYLERLQPEAYKAFESSDALKTYASALPKAPTDHRQAR
jgi:hypothetical protein